MNQLFDNKLIATAIMIAVFGLIRYLVVRHLRKRPSDETDIPRRWINTINNITSLSIAIGLIMIWMSELRFVALSIATFVVALVIATREFIQCFLGAFYLASTRKFSVGDWIKIAGHYGEVVSSDWLSTTLLEIDMKENPYSYTGRTVFIPNNQFVSNPIQNLNFMRRYVEHTFSIYRDPEEVNVAEAKDMILQAANELCAPFNDVASRYSYRIEKRLGVKLSGPQAQVRVTTTDFSKNVFTITIFCPTQEAVNIEQKLIEQFMRYWYQEQLKSKQRQATPQ